MKRCPQCGREYDNTMSFCLDDGSELLYGPATMDEPKTAILHATEPPSEAATRAQIHMTDQTAVLPSGIGDVPKKSFDKRLLFAPLALVVIILGGFFAYRYFKPADGGQINSIAILPFENRNSDADMDYLSDGLAESLIYRLSQLPNLKVSPTSSVFRYKGREADPQTIAKELGVDSVMTGRISQRGDNLNISVNLVDTRNGKSLWGEQYERKLSELLATQREIATEITNKLQLKLSGEGEQKLAKKYTNNGEAYQLYLRGGFHFARRSKDELIKAIDYYQQAIKLDPDFALAYVGISLAYSSGRSNQFFPQSEALEKANEAATRALEIDPNLADAHSALGLILNSEWKFAEAEREHKRAIELDPNSASAHYNYGVTLESLGLMDKALSEKKTAVKLEPLSLQMNANLAGAYMFNGQNDIALAQARKTYELDPSFIAGRFWLMWVYCANKKYAEVVKLYEASAKDEASQPLFAQFGGYAYAKTDRRGQAQILVGSLTQNNENHSYYPAALIYCALGENEKAIAEIEKGYLEKFSTFGRVRTDPLLEDMRADPRYKEMLKRLNLPE